MSNFNVQDQKWVDIIFENQNKAYGAYQLRKENDRTTIGALLFSALFFTGAVLLMSFTFTGKPAPIKPKDDEPIKPKETIVLVKIDQAKKNEPKGEENTKKTIKKENLAPKVTNEPIKVPEKEKKEEEKKPIIDNPNGSENGTKSGPEGKPEGKDPADNKPITPGGDDGEGKKPENGIFKPGVEAKYPGGINKFREFIAENYKVPSSFESNILSIEIYFIVEKDGTMTGYKMIKGDKSLEKEAIRVLKAMNKKWSPGYVNGEAVRSEYRVPIQIQIQEED
jgi:periplasmic protein TonB